MLGVAEGLHYLHECCERRIIHRDIKADNILLSEDFQPQVFLCAWLVVLSSLVGCTLVTWYICNFELIDL